MKHVRLFLSLSCAIALFPSCDKKVGKDSAQSKIATKRGNDTAIAQSGEEIITVDRFKAEFLHSRKADTPAARREVLDELVQRIKLVRIARENGLADDVDYAREVEDILINRLRESPFAQQIAGQSKVAPDAALKYFNAHPEEFATPTRARVSMIFVAATKANRDGKKPIIEKAREEALAAKQGPTENFGFLAARYSEDPRSKASGGDIGYLIQDKSESHTLPSIVFETAFSLEKTGDISDIIESKNGFYLIKITDRADGVMPRFEDIEPQIRARLAADSRKNINSLLDEKMAEKTDATINEALLKSTSINVPGK